MTPSILVVAEHRRGVLCDVTLELLGLARRLSEEQPAQVAVLLCGSEAAGLAGSLHGLADEVLLCPEAGAEAHNPEVLLPLLGDWVRPRLPVLVLVAHTAAGMELAPAAALHVGLPHAADCISVELREDRLVVRRQVFAGRLHEVLTLRPASGQVLSLRPGCFPIPEGHPGLPTRVTPLPLSSPRRSPRRRFLELVCASAPDLDITRAEILCAVGRGLGKPENLAQVQAFADAIGATLACSRPVADQGWLPRGRQVGTSGKTVRPRLYIALGISGAYQHEAGMRGSGTIIAVNKDPRAPIFGFAHYGLVADMFEVLPLLGRELGNL